MENQEAFDLNGIVQVAESSIVSKQFIKKDGGNITFFAFDKGEGLSEHTSPFEAFVQVLESEGQIIIDGKSYTVKTGQGIKLPANIPHGIKAEQAFKMMLVMIK